MFLFRIFVFCVQERDVKLYLQLLRRTLLPKTQIFTLISNPNAKLEKNTNLFANNCPFASFSYFSTFSQFCLEIKIKFCAFWYGTATASAAGT
jgi:hypothetical protein